MLGVQSERLKEVRGYEAQETGGKQANAHRNNPNCMLTTRGGTKDDSKMTQISK
jgi:hypothetical protein